MSISRREIRAISAPVELGTDHESRGIAELVDYRVVPDSLTGTIFSLHAGDEGGDPVVVIGMHRSQVSDDRNAFTEDVGDGRTRLHVALTKEAAYELYVLLDEYFSPDDDEEEERHPDMYANGPGRPMTAEERGRPSAITLTLPPLSSLSGSLTDAYSKQSIKAPEIDHAVAAYKRYMAYKKTPGGDNDKL
jgi:hypothetical protein